MAARGLEFHRQLDAAAEANLKEPTYVDAPYTLVPVVGIMQPTIQSARLRDGRVEFLTVIRDDDPSGDGVVPRPSAIPVHLSARSERYQFSVAERHASLPRNHEVLAYVRNVITGAGSGDVYRGVTRDWLIGVDVEDVFSPDEPIVFRIRGDQSLQLVSAHIENVENTARYSVSVSPGEGAYEAQAGPLPPGTYRAVAADEESGQTVSDLFVVVAGEPHAR
jgi:hypothetical protein